MPDDTELGTEDFDIHDGGRGDDNLDGGGELDVIFGGSGADTLTGGTGNDYIFGGGDNDTIYGGSENDLIRGGSGDDNITGGSGRDTIFGDAGDDTIDGGSEKDTIYGGTGDDTLTGGGSADTFAFNEGGGNDTVTDFDTARDMIDLTLFNTAITWEQLSAKITTVTDPNDVNVVTGLQIDLSDFGGGTITLDGLTSTSDLTADMFCLPDGTRETVETMEGSAWCDLFIGDTGGDTYNTYGGNDIVFAEEGDDTINGGSGDDWLVGGEGADTIDGGADDDEIYGGEGDDVLKGDAGEDEIYGGEGADTITGGTGDDTLTGGAGADTFVFASGDGNDTITDFTNGTDTIDLSAITAITGFSDLTVTQEGDDTKIDLGENVGEIILENFTSGDLDATDFDFSM